MRRFMMVLCLAAFTIVCTMGPNNALAVVSYIPPPDVTVSAKITDASGFLHQATPDDPYQFLPRSTARPSAGDQLATFFRFTSIKEGADPDFTPTKALFGTLQFLEYDSMTPVGPIGFGVLKDSSRTHTTATPGTLGRLFIFESDSAVPPTFDAVGSRPQDLVLDQLSDFGAGGPVYNYDSLPNFTDVPGMRLVATGSLVDNDGTPDGLISQFFTPSGQNGVRDQSTIATPVKFDAGEWFVAGIKEASIAINFFSIKDTVVNYADITPTTIREDAFLGGWHDSSEDPLTIQYSLDRGIPEPATAGLSLLGLSVLGLAATRRRRRL